MITIYGLPNCDSTKAAIKYYKQHAIAFHLHDLRAEGISKSKLSDWVKEIGLDKVLNKKSTTWRSLDVAEQEKANSIEGAIDLMNANTNLVKRPVIETGNKFTSIGVVPGGAKK